MSGHRRIVLTSAVWTRSSARSRLPVRTTPNRSSAGNAATTNSSKSSTLPEPIARTAGCPASQGFSVALVGELAAQLQDRLRVHLTDATFGDAEHLTDLGERQALVVVEGDDDLLPLRQRVDGAREKVLRLLGLERLDRVLGLRVLERVDQRQLVAAFTADVEQLVERDDVDERHLAEDRVQVLEADAELFGNLRLRRRAMQPRLQGRVGLLDLAGLVSHRARDPV